MKTSGKQKEYIDTIHQMDSMKGKLKDTKVEANHLKDEIQKSLNSKLISKYGAGFVELGKKVDSFKSRMTKLISTVAILNLIRNKLSDMRNGFVNLLKSNTDFSNSLGRIKANLMTAFAPIYNACLPAINTLMTALSKLTGTIAIFVSGLFGKSIEDTQKDAKKLSKQLDNVNKSGKKASGSLASFDKLEVLSDNSSSGSTSGSTDVTPNYSGEIQFSEGLLNALNNIKNWIIENQEFVKGFLITVIGLIGLIKLIRIINEINAVTGVLKPLMAFISANAAVIGGIIAIVGGLAIMIDGIIKYLQDPTWENFGRILLGVGVIAAGVFLIFGGFPALITAIIGVVIALGLAIYKNWETIKSTLSKVGNWIYEHVIKPIADFFVGLWNGIVGGLKTAVDWIKSAFSSVVKFFSNIVSKIVTLFRNIGSKVGNAISGAFRTVINGILGAIEGILNFPIKSVNKLIGVINKVPGINIGTLPTFNLPRLAKGTVIPPRQEFAAILGDQKHGTNIEAPLETIKQANREVMQEFLGTLSNLNNGEREIVLRNLTFVLQFGTGNNFQKLVIDSIRLSEKELGRQLLLA